MNNISCCDVDERTFLLPSAVPPDAERDLPDLYRLIDSLEKEQGGLESHSEPPSLFTRDEHVPKYKKITELKMEMEVSIADSTFDFNVLRSMCNVWKKFVS